MPLPYNKEHKYRARELRKELTPAERVVWHRVRRKQLLGVQFYRQKPIGQYIADFYCPKAQLVVEVDGGQHWEPDRAEADQIRDAVFGQLGLKVLRFSNRDVMQQTEAVLEQIHRAVMERITPRSRGGNPP